MENRRVGRYSMHQAIASGGMATVYLGRMRGAVGFNRIVAIKRLHPHLAEDPDFAPVLIDEARISGRIRHPNVVTMLDVVHEGSELLLVMEYLVGESLSRLLRGVRQRGEMVPIPIVASIICETLHGLHAAHEALDENGEPLGIVHRDVSPQNIMVGADGISRVLDFGIAKSAGRIQKTEDGKIKGKYGYLSPEQLRGENVDRRVDVFAAGIILWETLTGERLFASTNAGEAAVKILSGRVSAPSERRSDSPKSLDAVVLRALARDPSKRFASARDMAVAVEDCVATATSRQVASWVTDIAGEDLRERATRVAEIERSDDTPSPVVSVQPSVVTSGAQDTTTSVSSDADLRARPPSRRVALPLLAGVAVLGALLGWRFWATARSESISLSTETSAKSSAQYPASAAAPSGFATADASPSSSPSSPPEATPVLASARPTAPATTVIKRPRHDDGGSAAPFAAPSAPCVPHVRKWQDSDGIWHYDPPTCQ